MAAGKEDATAAFVMAVFHALSFAYLLRADPRPHLFDVIFALAALLGTVGYVFGLFDGGCPTTNRYTPLRPSR